MVNNYELVTGFVTVGELEEISKEEDAVGAATTTLGCAIATLTFIIITEVACPTKACTGYCR